MKLSKPFVGEFKAGQLFGQNLTDVYIKDGKKGHSGIDFPMPNGTPVVSAVNGKVIAVSLDIRRGVGVAVISSDIFQYKGRDCVLDTIYWHLKEGSVKVKIGDRVKIGDLLGLSNNTGQSTGPHLHFSVIPMYPDGSRKTIESYENGYHAAVDPTLFLDLPDPLIKFKELQILLNKYGATLTVGGKFGKLSKQALTDFIG